MPEQQQDVDGEQHTQSSVLIEKKPISIPTHTTKVHKMKHRRRRHNKYPSSQATLQAMDNGNTNTIDDTPSMVEEASVLETMVDTPHPSSTEEAKETSVAVAEIDVETDPAVPAISKKKTTAEPFVPITPVVPTTPAIVEEANETLQSEGQGDRKGLPYIFAVALRVGKTLAVSLLPKERRCPVCKISSSTCITNEAGIYLIRVLDGVAFGICLWRIM